MKNVVDESSTRLALVTGATGYVGGRLIPELLREGWRVRVLVRHPHRVSDAEWFADVDVVAGDAVDPDSISAAMQGVDTAYYLMHSLTAKRGFSVTETTVAQSFADAARAAEIRRIVYLGGVVPDVAGIHLSEHMASRVHVGKVLRASGISTVELRAAVIIGSGSASFEMLRYLTERLPMMITPRWVSNRVQPIAIRNVLHYLVGAADIETSTDIFDIGGRDVLTYEQMMKRYARVAGLRRRRILQVPVLTPSLSSHWVGLVTPVPTGTARPLVESIKYDAVCRDSRIRDLVPDPPSGLMGFDEAVELALTRVQEAHVTTRWCDASVPGAPAEPMPTDPDWAGGSLYRDTRSVTTPAPIEQVWAAVEAIGGDTGWYSFPLAWQIRGWLDRFVGGVGLRRGRRDPVTLQIDDACDFWRVEERVAPRLLRLRAEMKLPGLAWLEFSLGQDPADPELTVLTQRAIFFPRGLAGHLYWWSVAPFHGIVFGEMIRGIERASRSLTPELLRSAA